MQKKTTNGVEIVLNSTDTVSVKLQNNFNRDVLYLMTKTLRARKTKAVMSLQNSPGNNENSELYVKVAEYEAQNEKQQTEISSLQSLLQEERRLTT